MITFHRSVVLLGGGLLLALVSLPFAQAQRRTAPDIHNRNAITGTGVDRNGIKSNSNGPRRTTNYVLPRRGYSYGYSQGPTYYSNYYYADHYYSDPYHSGGYPIGGYPSYSRGYYEDWYRRGPVYLPPVYGDAGSLYGPRATRKFLGTGVGNNRASRSGPLRVARATAPASPPPLSNPTARARAWRFVEQGDRHFKKGNYPKAAARYRKAATQASELAEIYFRQAFAETGAGRYPRAVMALRKGLRLQPNWPESGFVLEELFPSANAKRAIFRQLHLQMEEHPLDADALFLLAVMQHFDDQKAASEVAMRRVVKLTGAGEHARAFLPRAPVAEEANDLLTE